MNAQLTGPTRPIREVLDPIIADYGIKQVMLAVLGRLARRPRPPDDALQKRHKRLIPLDNHLRQDIGLPPLPKPSVYLDLTAYAPRDP